MIFDYDSYPFNVLITSYGSAVPHREERRGEKRCGVWGYELTLVSFFLTGLLCMELVTQNIKITRHYHSYLLSTSVADLEEGPRGLKKIAEGRKSGKARKEPSLPPLAQGLDLPLNIAESYRYSNLHPYSLNVHLRRYESLVTYSPRPVPLQIKER